MNLDVAVIGGGISGLVVAHKLASQGHRVIVLERQVRAGGNAVSERVGGFLMEHGPSAINAMSPCATALSSSLGLDGRRVELGADIRRRYLVNGRRLHAIPLHPFGFLTTSYLSWRSRARVAVEALVPRRSTGDDETVAAFWSRRFGAEFAARVVDPMVAGMFAGRAEELSMTAVFPRLLTMERRHGSITRGMIESRRAGGRMPGGRLFSWRDGIGTLPRRLVEELGQIVRTGCTVRGIRSVAGGFRLDCGADGTLRVRAVVVATQPHAAAALLENVDAPSANAAGMIGAPPLAVVFLGYRRRQVDHALDGVGYLTATGEGRALSGALFCSTMFSGRAPKGHVAVAGYVGGARAPELARRQATDLIAITRAEFGDLLGVRGEPDVARVRHWTRGLPQLLVGHGDRIEALRSLPVRLPGMFVTGNYIIGPSIANCIEQAGGTAAEVDAFLLDRERREQVSGLAVRSPGLAL